MQVESDVVFHVYARNATSSSGVSCPCAGHWPPSKLWAVVISTAPSTGSPGRSAASLAAALAERLLVFAGSPELPQQPVHHWHPPNKQLECRFKFCLISSSCAVAMSQSVLILVNKAPVTSKNSRSPCANLASIADSERSSACFAQRPRCV